MAYATISEANCDDNFIRHVGWKESNECIKSYFSNHTVKNISFKISQLLQGVDHQGRKIVVPDKTICSVMSEIYNSYRPPTGDIHTRYVVPTGEPDNYIQSMIDQVIEVITNDVKNNLGMEECNKNLSIWSTLYGDFNNSGLKQHAKIKVREKNTNHRGMVSFMNY
jgi:hypothetical protein